MSYVDAPATALVAMSCCVCGRELLEAESIASGIGPVCAEKTGFGRPGLPLEVRAEVNRLVYELAALQRSPDAIPRIARLRALGFDDLAERIDQRLDQLADVRIKIHAPNPEMLVVTFPFLAERHAFLKLLAGLRAIPGYRLTSATDNLVPNTADAIRALYEVLSRVFAGRTARSPKGLFIMPTETELAAAYARRRTQQGARS